MVEAAEKVSAEPTLSRATEESVKRALADIGHEGKEAALDIRDLRRLVRRIAMLTVGRISTTGVMLALLAGIAINLKIFGSGP